MRIWMVVLFASINLFAWGKEEKKPEMNLVNNGFFLIKIPKDWATHQKGSFVERVSSFYTIRSEGWMTPPPKNKGDRDLWLAVHVESYKRNDGIDLSMDEMTRVAKSLFERQEDLKVLQEKNISPTKRTLCVQHRSNIPESEPFMSTIHCVLIKKGKTVYYLRVLGKTDFFKDETYRKKAEEILASFRLE